ncbi:MAG: prolipoprotein diacylglyceryl transferase [Phycisphaeraceae bacterium]|nr:prolipoprotein diacylglyceryl transferase [Phycisphaeraceae bacterium]
MLTLAAYLHDLDPYAIKLWEGGPIRWYGISYIAGFYAGYLILRRMARRGVSPLPPERVADFVVALIVGILAGGRLGYVLLYRPDLLLSFSGSFPFWDVLAVNQGGMASHGGVIGMVLACLWFARRHDITFPHLVDLTALTAPIGVLLGRVANFVNGELYGRACDDGFLFAVRFPQEIASWSGDGLAALEAALKPTLPDPPPADLVTWVLNEVPNGNAKMVSIVEPMLTSRHPSQLYQALLEGLVLFVVLAAAWTRPRKPGVITGLACVVYSVVRMVGEQFREPDAHIGFTNLLGLEVTRGQMLSMVMLAAGIAIMLVCTRRPVERLRGVFDF